MGQYKKSSVIKQKIIQTSSKLFYEKGFKRTTSRDIAGALGISLGSLTYHFPNKTDIANIICNDYLENYFLKIKELFYDKFDNILVRDEIHIRCFVKTFVQDNNYMRFYHELANENLLSELLVDSDYRHLKEQNDYMHGDMPDDLMLAYAYAFVAIMISMIKAKRENKITLDLKETLDVCNRLHLNMHKLDSEQTEQIIAEAAEYEEKVTIKLLSLTDVSLTYNK